MLRRCLVTREHGSRDRMLRFVVGPDRAIVPDLLARLPGRGLWLSPRADVIEAAVSKGLFARAARGPVTLPPDLLMLLEGGLARRVIDLLGLARRAGQAVAGFEKAREVVVQGQARLVIQARDGSPDECRRLMSGASEVPAFQPLPAARLGIAFGRDHVVHVAVRQGGLAERLEAECFRLASLTGAGPGKDALPSKGGAREDGTGHKLPRQKRGGVKRSDG